MNELFKNINIKKWSVIELIQEAIRISKQNNQTYYFDYNEIRIEIFPSDTVQELYTEYQRELTGLGHRKEALARLKEKRLFNNPLIVWLKHG